jgi:DNA-binding CsgD family transcriptional regulator
VDWIRVIEAAYDVEREDHLGWLASVAAAIGKGMGGELLGELYYDGLQFRMFPLEPHRPDVAARLDAMSGASEEVAAVHRCGPFTTVSMLIGRRTAHGLMRNLHPMGICDIMGMNARDGGPWGVTLSVGLPKSRRVTAREAQPWARVAGHVHAALRFRFRLHGTPDLRKAFTFRSSAVFSPSGKLLHAEPEARGASMALQRAAVAIDRARARMRREDPEGALGAWHALVEGEWSLVETFERDGRRYLVAHRNPPHAPRAARLTDRERHVLGLRARMHDIKVIAYELGVSQASVSRALTKGMRKLGFSSITELMGFVRPTNTISGLP